MIIKIPDNFPLLYMSLTTFQKKVLIFYISILHKFLKKPEIYDFVTKKLDKT